MKYVLLIVACLVIPSLALTAPADSSSTDNTRPNSLHAGAWALHFSIGSGFYDAEVMAKRQLSGASALRLGVSFNLRSESAESSFDTTVVVTSDDRDRDEFGTRIDLMWQHYPDLFSQAQFYFGLGPFVGYSEFDEDGRRESAPSYDYSYEYSTHNERLDIGASFAIGAEWFASKALSLFTEYNVEGGYSRNTGTQIRDRDGAYAPLTDKFESTSWFFRTGSAHFGVGFYF